MSSLEATFEPGGALSRLLAGYVYRPQQVDVAKVIARSGGEKPKDGEPGNICLAEAGTGVGKTMVYLVPALDWIRDGKRVVVSTHTLNLQSQLVRKDIPLLQRLAGKRGLEAVLVKGMGNYLCLQNLEFESTQLSLMRDPAQQRLVDWAGETESGDLAELPFTPRNWSDVSCDRDTCHRQDCRHYGDCFYFNMRRAAEQADLVVANHALFFSDLAIRMAEPSAGILPAYDHVIFDEAHHLEDVASRIFGIEFSNYRIPSFLNRVRRLRGLPLDPALFDSLERLNVEFFDQFTPVRKQEFFLSDVFDTRGISRLNGLASDLLVQLRDLSGALSMQAREHQEPEDSMKERLEGYARTSSRLHLELQSLMLEEAPETFQWGERNFSPGRVVHTVLRRTPVSVADLLREKFWNRTKGATLVSATLSNSGGFSYARSRLGIPEANEVVVGSPFDFSKQCLLYVPAHLPFPSNDPAYVQEVVEEMARILTYSQGRAFLLFTSYRMLERVHDELLSRVEFPLLRQGERPNAALLEEFRRTPHACLLGTNSFWEGVDVQGEQLSCVIIDKLPFSVPDTPIARARVEAIERDGGNAFAELSVPEAQIRLKQGFGRLIRTSSDRGVVAIFDSRLVKKSYGRSFLEVLPPAKRTRSLDDVRRFYEAGVPQPEDAATV